MTVKKLKVKTARMFKKLMDCSFINSQAIANAYLNDKEYTYSDRNYELGFEYRYEMGADYHETLEFQGSVRHAKTGLPVDITKDILKMKELKENILKKREAKLYGI